MNRVVWVLYERQSPRKAFVYYETVYISRTFPRTLSKWCLAGQCDAWLATSVLFGYYETIALSRYYEFFHELSQRDQIPKATSRVGTIWEKGCVWEWGWKREWEQERQHERGVESVRVRKLKQEYEWEKRGGGGDGEREERMSVRDKKSQISRERERATESERERERQRALTSQRGVDVILEAFGYCETIYNSRTFPRTLSTWRLAVKRDVWLVMSVLFGFYETVYISRIFPRTLSKWFLAGQRDVWLAISVLFGYYETITLSRYYEFFHELSQRGKKLCTKPLNRN